MRQASILLVSLIALAIAACDSPDITGTDDPSRANLDPPDNPDLCRPACEALTGQCEAVDDGGDVEILQGCIESCLQGDFEDSELECLAAADCATADQCLE